MAPERAALGAIIGIAAVVRLIHANAEFWFDEIITVINFVRAPLASVVTHYNLANNHVMNSVLTNLSASYLGEDPWAVRLPAILFGIAGVWAFWFVATAVWPRVPVLFGTLLFAASYHHIYYSQNARGYSALIFFGLLSTGFLLRLLAGELPASALRASARLTPRWQHAVGYSVAVGLGLYAMLLMAFIVAGQAAVLVALRRWRGLGALGAGVGLAALLYAPMAGSLVEYYRTHAADTGFPLLSREFARALAPIAVLLVAAGVVALPVLIRFGRRQPVAAALIVAPMVFNVAIPLLRGQGVYPRSFVFGLAVAYLLLVEALDWALATRRAIAWIATGVIAAASFIKLAPYYQLPKQGFRQALAYIDDRRAASDDRIGLTLGGKAARFYDPSIILIETAADLRARTAGSGRPAWIISTFAAQMEATRPELSEWLRAEASDKAEFGGVVGDGTVHVHYWPRAGRTP